MKGGIIIFIIIIFAAVYVAVFLAILKDKPINFLDDICSLDNSVFSSNILSN